jgi:hypothetical protein
VGQRQIFWQVATIVQVFRAAATCQHKNKEKPMTQQDCEFTFQCNKRWQDLTTIGHDKNRFCGECRRAVRLCRTEVEKDLNAAIGRCVAYKPKPILQPMIGRPMGYQGFIYDIPEANVYLLPGQALSDRQREEIVLLFPEEQQAAKGREIHDAVTPVLLFRLAMNQAEQLLKDLQDELGIQVELEGEML